MQLYHLYAQQSNVVRYIANSHFHLVINLAVISRNYFEDGTLITDWLFLGTEVYSVFCQQGSFRGFDYTS